jgi:hypothetical protein
VDVYSNCAVHRDWCLFSVDVPIYLGLQVCMHWTSYHDYQLVSYCYKKCVDLKGGYGAFKKSQFTENEGRIIII